MSWLDGDGAAFDPAEIEDPNLELAEADVGFTGPDIETDEQQIAAQVFNRLAAKVPGWEAHDGNPDTWLIEAFAVVAAELRALIRDVPDAIFITHGTEVLGMPIRAPAPALGVSRWTARDDRGYQIRTGAQITIARTGDDLVGFEVLAGAEIAPGETVVENVPIRAVEDGAAGNGLLGPAEVSDPLDWVESVIVPRATTDGDDGQDRTQYLGMLSNLLRIVAFRPVLPGDFALLALTIPGVGRAVAMDGYDPIADTWGHVRRVCLVVAGDDGRPLPDPVRAQVRAYLESIREVNFIVDVISPQYDTVDVDFSVTMFGEQDPDTVLSITTSALEQELDPANFRLGTLSPATGAGEVIPPPAAGELPGRQTIWRNNLIGLLDRCRGVDRVDFVQINGNGDLELGGPFTLPQPGQITGVVNTP
jgi:Baseplate J-like protein